MLILSNDALVVLAATNTAAATNTVTSTIDLGASPEFDSVCFLTRIATPNAGNFCKVGAGALANGSDASDIAGSKVTPTGAVGSGSSVFIDVMRPPNRFITLSAVLVGASSALGDIYAILYNSKGGPIVQPTAGATVSLGTVSTNLTLFGKTLVAPLLGTA